MLLERFIKYVKIDTQSDDYCNDTPSTQKQFDLLNVLKGEFKALGVQNELTKSGRLYAFIPGNPKLEAIGLCAHVDTAPDFSGSNVNPKIIKNYDGEKIVLGESGRILDPNEYEFLKAKTGKTLIVTDGTTLLGADDKAGIAITMEVVEEILKLDETIRRPMYVLFTPDEEIGRGAEEFDRNKFAAEFAFTFDGSEPDVLNIETFNAKAAKLDIIGKSIHPGDAKGIMVNAGLVANEFISMLPKKMIPAKTSGREGFNHLTDFSGGVDHSEVHYIIRNHDKLKLNKQANLFEKIANKLAKKYPTAKINLKITDQYSNMFEIISKKPACKDFIENIYNKLGISYKYEPIRGGTDGATFSFKGCPTPNLGTGSYNHHGPYEFAVLEEMEQLVQIGIEMFKQ